MDEPGLAGQRADGPRRTVGGVGRDAPVACLRGAGGGRLRHPLAGDERPRAPHRLVEPRHLAVGRAGFGWPHAGRTGPGLRSADDRTRGGSRLELHRTAAEPAPRRAAAHRPGLGQPPCRLAAPVPGRRGDARRGARGREAPPGPAPGTPGAASRRRACRGARGRGGRPRCEPQRDRHLPLPARHAWAGNTEGRHRRMAARTAGQPLRLAPAGLRRPRRGAHLPPGLATASPGRCARPRRPDRDVRAGHPLPAGPRPGGRQHRGPEPGTGHLRIRPSGDGRRRSSSA